MRFLVAVSCIVFLSFGIAAAHSVGASFETVKEGYTIDIGYDPAEVSGDDRVILDFSIEKDGEPVPYDSVWVRLTSGGTTLLATGIARASVGPTTLLYTVPDTAEEIVINARFDTDESPLAAAEFTLPVSPPERGIPIPYIATVLAGVCLFVLLFTYYVRRRQ